MFRETSSIAETGIANIIGFKSFKHEDTGLNVNISNVIGPIYSMSVVIPVLFRSVPPLYSSLVVLLDLLEG